MAQIDNLTLEITADSAKAVNALTNLSNALNSFKTSMPTKAKFDNMAQGFKGLREEISKHPLLGLLILWVRVKN